MTGQQKRAVIFTCEHAGNDIPESLSGYFQHQQTVLHSHRGWDPGAWEVATYLAARLNAPLFGTFTSRLVIEANRSHDNPQLFSEFTNALSNDKKEQLLREYYLPYRTNIESVIHHHAKPVIHLSIHTFTPIWNGAVRDVDIGLLFDPARQGEREFCAHLRNTLQKQNPTLTIKFNEPYHGTDDGFTTYLRTKFNDDYYHGIEIEINQKFFESNELTMIGAALLNALRDA